MEVEAVAVLAARSTVSILALMQTSWQAPICRASAMLVEAVFFGMGSTTVLPEAELSLVTLPLPDLLLGNVLVALVRQGELGLFRTSWEGIQGRVSFGSHRALLFYLRMLKHLLSIPDNYF